ncbi:MAG: thrombospondin type 3 repeat-containing protein [Verrucomicrobia bacterium]|jgi:hypothetical protein|nr:thrombospondin type 3 repeat-containing protein [Verrucomicrobiota bacterium]
MKMMRESFVGCLVVLLCHCLFPCVALAAPREPWPPLPEFAPVLFHESFDGIYGYGMTNTAWVVADYGTLMESWSAYALERAGKVTPFVVPGLDSAGHTNVASEGALRWWVKPYWSSAPEGKGPGTDARLVELAVVGGKQAAAVWWLQVNPDGTVVSLIEQGDTGPVTLLKAEICWPAGQWHQIVLNYGGQTALAIDGEIVAKGDGPVKVPPKVAALVMGSRLTGADSIGGELEELFTFSRPLEVAFHYAALKDQAALGPVSPEEEQALAEARAKWQAGHESGGGNPLMLRLVGGTSECITNVPVYITNIVSSFDTNSGCTVMFDIQGSYDGTTTTLYDVFMTTNLVGDGATGSQWVWLEQGPSCSTYQYTNQSDAMSYYILGTPLDSDGDGLTDAYEKLVSKTNPSLWDTDGDGLSDGWEVAHGMNPNVNESAQTSGRINYQYDAAGWLRVVSGIWGEGITLDAEGNVQQLP